MIIRVSSSHSCSVLGPGYCQGHLWRGAGRAEDRGVQGRWGGRREERDVCTSRRHAERLPYSIWIACTCAAAVCCHLGEEQCHQWSPCTPPLGSCEFRQCPGETASSPDQGVLRDAMETDHPLCSKRCVHGRKSRPDGFGHSWVQQSTSRPLGEGTVSQRHAIQLTLVIKAEKEFGFCSSAEASGF